MEILKIPTGVTFVDYYRILRSMEHPANTFKRLIAEATSKSSITVTNWCSGKYPEPLAQRVIADLTGSSIEQLFPIEQSATEPKLDRQHAES